MVIPRFVQQALAGEPLTVHGSGSQSRCFGHVRDVVRALIGLMETPAADGQVFNIGNPQETTIRALAEKVILKTRSRSKIEYVPYSEAYGPDFEDLERRVPDTRRLAGVIEWDDLATLDEILDDVIESARDGAR
jgi:UDP-glucose 4-epimerase